MSMGNLKMTNEKIGNGKLLRFKECALYRVFPKIETPFLFPLSAFP
jgi:hypothetical protein